MKQRASESIHQLATPLIAKDLRGSTHGRFRVSKHHIIEQKVNPDSRNLEELAFLPKPEPVFSMAEVLKQANHAMRPAQEYSYTLNELMSSVDQNPLKNQRITLVGSLFEGGFSNFLKLISNFSNFRLKFLIFLSACLFTVCAFVNNLIGDVLLRKKFEFTQSSLVAALGLSLACSLFATFLCRNVKYSEGSALPELRAITNGTPFPDFFELKIFPTKFIALLFAKLSGAGVGTFAPFVHMSAILTHSMFELPFFQDLQADHNLHFAMISTTVVTPNVVFYSPIGSIFFALEFFGSTIKMYSIFRIVLAAASSYFTSKLMNMALSVSLPPPIPVKEWFESDLLHFVLLGAAGALLVWGILKIHTKILFIKRGSKSVLVSNRYLFTGLATFVLILVSYQHNFFASSFRSMMFDFFTVSDFTKEQSYVTFWYADSSTYFIVELVYLLSVRVLMIVLMMNMPLPAGVFGPAILIGILLGRLYGEIAVLWLNCSTNPVVFALAGGSLVVCLLNKAFSPLLFVVEFSRNFDFVLPIFVTYLSGFVLSSLLNVGFLEMTLAIRKLPFLVAIPPMEKVEQEISILAKDPPFSISSEATLEELFSAMLNIDLLDAKDPENTYIPVISPKTNFIEGYFTLEDAIKYLQIRFRRISDVTKSKKTLHSVAQSLVLIQEKEYFFSEEKKREVIVRNIHALFDLIAKDEIEMTEVSNRNSQSNLRAGSLISQHDESDSFEAGLRSIQLFLSSISIDFRNPLLRFKDQPVIIPPSSKFIKVQFMFLTLNVRVLWVSSGTSKTLQFVSLQDLIRYKLP